MPTASSGFGMECWRATSEKNLQLQPFNEEYFLLSQSPKFIYYHFFATALVYFCEHQLSFNFLNKKHGV